MQWSPSLDLIFKVIEAAVILGGLAYSVQRMKEKDRESDEERKDRDEQIKQLNTKIDIHTSDSRRHIDPDRDERRWSEMQASVKEARDGISRANDQLSRQGTQLDILIRQTTNANGAQGK